MLLSFLLFQAFAIGEDTLCSLDFSFRSLLDSVETLSTEGVKRCLPSSSEAGADRETRSQGPQCQFLREWHTNNIWRRFRQANLL